MRRIITKRLILITHAFTKKVLNRTVLFILRGNAGINYVEKVQKKTSSSLKKKKESTEQQKSQLEIIITFLVRNLN